MTPLKKFEVRCDICEKEINPGWPHEYNLPSYEYYSPVLAEFDSWQITGSTLRLRLAPKIFDVCPECASKIKGFIDTLNPLQNSISSESGANE